MGGGASELTPLLLPVSVRVVPGSGLGTSQGSLPAENRNARCESVSRCMKPKWARKGYKGPTHKHLPPTSIPNHRCASTSSPH